MKKIMSSILILIFLSFSFQHVFAGQKTDWSVLKNFTNREIAVRLRGEKTIFGILRAADDSGLQMQVADKKNISTANTSYRRDEVEKIWLAELRFSGRQIGKGALIGAGAGAVVGTGLLVGAAKDNDDGLAGAIIPLTTIYGAAIGAAIGFFKRKSHQKKNLIYRI